MRNFIIPALCAITLLGTSTLSFADAVEETKQTTEAENMLDKATGHQQEAWVNDTHALPY